MPYPKLKFNTKINTSHEDFSLYRSLVGTLQYLTFSKPNISYVIEQAYLFIYNLMDVHIHALLNEYCTTLKTLVNMDYTFIQHILHL